VIACERDSPFGTNVKDAPKILYSTVPAFCLQVAVTVLDLLPNPIIVILIFPDVLTEVDVLFVQVTTPVLELIDAPFVLTRLYADFVKLLESIAIALPVLFQVYVCE
jgi:hypothetical protein